MSHQRAKNIARGGEGVHPNQISGSHRLFNVIAQSISCTLNRTAQHAHEWNRKMCHKMRIKSSSLKIIKLLGNSNIYFVTVNIKKICTTKLQNKISFCWSIHTRTYCTVTVTIKTHMANQTGS